MVECLPTPLVLHPSGQFHPEHHTSHGLACIASEARLPAQHAMRRQPAFLAHNPPSANIPRQTSVFPITVHQAAAGVRYAAKFSHAVPSNVRPVPKPATCPTCPTLELRACTTCPLQRIMNVSYSFPPGLVLSADVLDLRQQALLNRADLAAPLVSGEPSVRPHGALLAGHGKAHGGWRDEHGSWDGRSRAAWRRMVDGGMSMAVGMVGAGLHGGAWWMAG
eukprot:365748-Chlamydomonas_euryale.AAC.8